MAKFNSERDIESEKFITISVLFQVKYYWLIVCESSIGNSKISCNLGYCLKVNNWLETHVLQEQFVSLGATAKWYSNDVTWSIWKTHCFIFRRWKQRVDLVLGSQNGLASVHNVLNRWLEKYIDFNVEKEPNVLSIIRYCNEATVTKLFAGSPESAYRLNPSLRTHIVAFLEVKLIYRNYFEYDSTS